MYLNTSNEIYKSACVDIYIFCLKKLHFQESCNLIGQERFGLHIQAARIFSDKRFAMTNEILQTQLLSVKSND